MEKKVNWSLHEGASLGDVQSSRVLWVLELGFDNICQGLEEEETNQLAWLLVGKRVEEISPFQVLLLNKLIAQSHCPIMLLLASGLASEDKAYRNLEIFH